MLTSAWAGMNRIKGNRLLMATHRNQSLRCFYTILVLLFTNSTCFASSPSGTTIPSATQIVDSTNGVWTLSGGTCYRNGVQAAGTVPVFDCAGIVSVLWYQGYTYVNASDGTWWRYTGVWWTSVAGDPRGGQAGLVLNAPWTLTINQDFTQGDAPSLYSTFCGQQGSVNGPNSNNFVPGNVYWQNGALVLRLQNVPNTSCTGITRPYAGAGFALNTPAANSIAVEFEIMGSNVYGAAPYAGLGVAAGVNPSCGWGVEDDFFEQNSTNPPQNVQTYHSWTPSACVHQYTQAFSYPSNIATSWHKYAVVRDGGSEFFIDGVAQQFSNGQYIATSDFQNYQVSPQIGLGTYAASLPNPTQLPAYIQVRSIKVWYKQ